MNTNPRTNSLFKKAKAEPEGIKPYKSYHRRSQNDEESGELSYFKSKDQNDSSLMDGTFSAVDDSLVLNGQSVEFSLGPKDGDQYDYPIVRKQFIIEASSIQRIGGDLDLTSHSQSIDLRDVTYS